MLGGLLFGIATFRAGILPRWAGVLLALGTVLAPVAGLLPYASQPKIAVPVGLALAWLGYALWSERRAPEHMTTEHDDRIHPHPSSQRKISLAAGILYLLTFVSIPTLALYSPVKGANYIIGSGPDTAAIVAVSWRSSWLSPASAPPSRCSRCSRSRTKVSRWASSPPEFWNPAPSSSASRSSCRS